MRCALIVRSREYRGKIPRGGSLASGRTKIRAGTRLSGKMTRAIQLGVVAGIGLAAFLLLLKGFRAKEEPFTERLVRDAEQLNGALPEIVSRGVRLDKAAAGPGNAFSYFYTVLEESTAREITGSAARLAELRAQLKQRVCLSMPEYREHGTVVRYALRSSHGRSVADISIDPRQCD
jgi:hypothetical protein